MKKYVITVVLALSLPSFFCQKAHADLFGGGDAALLVQQILQFGQDASMHLEDFSHITSLLNDVQSATKTLGKFIEMGKVVNNTLTCSKKIISCYKIYRSYYDYLSGLDISANTLNHAYSYYTTYNYKTANLIKSTNEVIASISNFSGEDPFSLMQALNSVTDNMSSMVDSASKEAKNGIVSQYQKAKSEVVANENVEFMKTMWP